MRINFTRSRVDLFRKFPAYNAVAQNREDRVHDVRYVHNSVDKSSNRFVTAAPPGIVHEPLKLTGGIIDRSQFLPTVPPRKQIQHGAEPIPQGLGVLGRLDLQLVPFSAGVCYRISLC